MSIEAAVREIRRETLESALRLLEGNLLIVPAFGATWGPEADQAERLRVLRKRLHPDRDPWLERDDSWEAS